MEPMVCTSRLKTLLWICPVIFLLCSCGAERTCEPDRGSTALEYFPLAVENNWTYFRGSRADSFWIDSTWTHVDTTFFAESGCVIDGPGYFYAYYAVYPDGSIWRLLVSVAGLEYSMMLPATPAVGQEWIMTNEDTVRITTDTTISVPAGTFECLKVVRWRHATGPEDPGIYRETCYAPEVGAVLYRGAGGFAPEDVEVWRELRSYHVR